MRLMQSLTFVCLLFAVGCVPVESHKPAPKPPLEQVESDVTKAVRLANRARDAAYATELTAIAGEVDGGQLKFDTKLKQRMDEAREKAVSAANPGLAKVMADHFGPNALESPGKVSQALRDFAAALK